MLHKNGDARN